MTPAQAESRGSLVVAAQVVCIVDDDSVRQALDGLVRSAGLQAAAFALEYANQFQHDTNPGTFETVAINDAELKGFVTRAVTASRSGSIGSFQMLCEYEL